MKPKFARLLAAAVTSVLALSSAAFAADVTKADNTNLLDLGTSWGGGTAPTSIDIATWAGPYDTAGSLSAGFTASTPVSWQGIKIGSLSGTAAGLVSIGGTGGAATGSSITIGSSGIDMTAANQNLVINSLTTVLNGSQTWDIASGRNLRFGTTGTGAANANIDGSGTITVQGGGVVDLNQGSGSGSGLAGFSGKWVVNSGTTLRGLRSGTEAWGTNTAADIITLSGGTLAVGGITGANGNWSWSSNITLTTATNSTISAQNPDATARSLDLTGAITGSGNLTFSKTQSGGHTFVLKNFGITTGGVRTNIMGSGDVTINGVTLQLRPEGGGSGLSYTHNNNLKLVGGTLHAFDGINTFAGNIALEGANTVLSNWNGKNVFLNGTIANGGVAGSLILKPGQSESSNTITVNGNNTYTGGTTLGDDTGNRGIVVVGHNKAFGNGTVQVRGAQLRAGTTGINMTNAFSVGNGGFRLGGTNAFTLSGTTSIDNNSRTIANYGSATIILGNIDVNSGTSSIAAFDNAAGAGSGTQLIVNGNVTGVGKVAVSAGNVAFNGTNSHTGGTAISGGNISGTGSFTSSPITMSGGSIMLAGGATTTSLTLSGGVTFTGAPTVKFASNPVASSVYDVFTYGAGSVTGANLLTAAWRGVLSDDVPNQKYIFTAGASAARTWNTTSGTWDNIGTNANWLEGDQKFYDLDSATFGNIASNSTITLSGNLNPSAVSVINAANTYNFTGGAIVGASALTKSGDGTLALATQHSYTGGTIVNGGVLDLTGGGGAAGTIRGTVTINTGAKLKLSNGDALGYNNNTTAVNVVNLVGGKMTAAAGANQTTTAKIYLTGGTIDGTVNLDLFSNNSSVTTYASAASSTISVSTMNLRQDNTVFDIADGAAADDLLISSKISNGDTGNHAMIKNGAGTMKLTALNVFTGNVTVNNGVLDLTSGGIYTSGYNGSNVVTVNTGGTLKLNSFAYSATASLGQLRDYGAARVINGGTVEVIGGTETTGNDFTIGANGGTFHYNPTATSNTLTLEGNSNSNVVLNGALTMRTDGNIVVTDVMEGTGSLTKTGNQTLTLNGNQTYTGATNVSGGKLVIGETGSITSNVTVAGGATLGGTGTITGNATISGTHAAGNSAGLQPVSGNVNYDAGTSIFEWELASKTQTGRGTNFDAVNVGGDLSINSGALFKIVLGTNFDGEDAFWTSTRTWDVFSVIGAKTDLFQNFALYNATDLSNPVTFGSYGTFTYGYTGNNGQLTWSAVPEPTSALAGLLIAAGLLRRRRVA